MFAVIENLVKVPINEYYTEMQLFEYFRQLLLHRVQINDEYNEWNLTSEDINKLDRIIEEGSITIEFDDWPIVSFKEIPQYFYYRCYDDPISLRTLIAVDGDPYGKNKLYLTGNEYIVGERVFQQLYKKSRIRKIIKFWKLYKFKIFMRQVSIRSKLKKDIEYYPKYGIKYLECLNDFKTASGCNK